MKTSNRILLSLLAVIVFYVSSALIELRVKGSDHHEVFTSESVELPEISHVIFQNLDHSIYLKPSEAPMLLAESSKEVSLEGMQYEIMNDTLLITDFGLGSENWSTVILHVGKGLRSVQCIKSHVTVYDIGLDSLDLDLVSGRVAIQGNHSLIHLILKVSENGEFDTFDTGLNSVELKLDHGDAEFRSPIKVLKGRMENESYLSISGVQDFQFSRDESSYLRHY